MRDLDQFFTKPHIARLCWMSLLPLLCKLTGKMKDELLFIEPSAGDGSFYDLFPENKVGVDIAPRRNIFIGKDFLEWKYKPFFYGKKDVVIVGNPPFGKRGSLAVPFFVKAASIAATIAFIVPVIFRKYFIHKQSPEKWRLVYSTNLPRNSFYTDSKGDYEVNTEFQVWTCLPSTHKDFRLTVPPPVPCRL